MQQGLVQYLILLPIIYLGIVTSIEDYRLGKIYSRHILLGLAVGAGWYAMLAFFHWYFLNDPSVLTDIVPRVIAATLIAFAVSTGMWWFNVWSAADAKLFTVFTLLMPLSVYMNENMNTFSPVILLVNAYSVAFVVITADFLVRVSGRVRMTAGDYRRADPAGRATMMSEAADYLKANWFSWLKTFLGLSFVLLMFRIVRGIAREELTSVVHWDDTTAFLILFLAFRPLHKLFQIKVVAVLIVGGLAAFVGYLFHLDPTGGRLFEMVGVGLWSLGLMMFREIYTYWTRLVEVKAIPLGELEEHMIVSQATREQLVAQEVFRSEEIKELGVEGLSEEHAKRIRQLYKNEQNEGMVEVEKTIPFAPFIFAGLIATFIAHGVLIRLG